MANVIGLKDTQSTVMAGLGTFTYNVSTTAVYEFTIQSTVTPPSTLSIVINQNGSPIDSSNTPTNNNTHLELSVIQPCTAADVITFVLTSSSYNDTQSQGVKSTIVITQND